MAANLEFIREYRGTLYAGDCAHDWRDIEVRPDPNFVFQNGQVCTICGDRRRMRIKVTNPFPVATVDTDQTEEQEPQ